MCTEVLIKEENTSFKNTLKGKKGRTPVYRKVVGAINNFMFEHKEVMSLFKYNGWQFKDKL